MYRLINSIKNYAWGTPDFIPDLLNLSQGNDEPVAELWLGAHPASPSMIIRPEGTIPLSEAPELPRSLPYLFKVLSAAAPLSIQVHPSLEQAKAGFAREEHEGIAISDPIRNYKDPNHKPEMLLALTPFDALCGIRDYREMISLGRMIRLGAWLPDFTTFCDQPSPVTLKACFRAMLRLDADTRAFLLKDAFTAMASLKDFPSEIFGVCEVLQSYYPGDIGSIFPLFMNILHLMPGDAIFLGAGTPHAYLKGSGLEIMANSDNVLRGALTPKHIDVPEFLSVCVFDPQAPPTVIPRQGDNIRHYQAPVRDFSLMLIDDPELTLPQPETAGIVLCLDGSSKLSCGSGELMLRKGDSAVYFPGEAVLCSGNAKLALAL